MKHHTAYAIALCLTTACTDHAGETATPADKPVRAELQPAPATQVAPEPTAEPTLEPAPEVAETKPERPPPQRFYVAAEGRCRRMHASIVDARALVHFASEPLVELGSDGAVTGLSIDTTIKKGSDPDTPWTQQLPEVVQLAGSLPDRLFAIGVEFPREGFSTAYRQTDEGWVPKHPFGPTSMERLWPWHDESMLALAPYTVSGPRFGVIKGRPKGPRFKHAMAKTGCKDVEVVDTLVQPEGDVVATWTCQGRGFFATHWTAGDLGGTTHDFGFERDDDHGEAAVTRTIASDRSGGFYVAARDEGGAQRLWHGSGERWTPIDVPKGMSIGWIATDPKGQLWIAGKGLARRDGEQWVEIALPVKYRVSQLAGLEFGTPWIRVGSAVWRIADDAAHPIKVPQSAFFEDEGLTVERLHVAGPDDVWAEAEYVVQRRGKGTPGRYYRAVLHSQPTKHPLRCGRLLDGQQMTEPFVPWPTAAGPGCDKRLALLLRRKKWDDDNRYDSFRRQIRKVDGIEGVRFAEFEIGADKFMGAISSDAALIETLRKKARKVRKYWFPEVVCGDQAVLDDAGVVVHRELDLAPDE